MAVPQDSLQWDLPLYDWWRPCELPRYFNSAVFYDEGDGKTVTDHTDGWHEAEYCSKLMGIFKAPKSDPKQKRIAAARIIQDRWRKFKQIPVRGLPKLPVQSTVIKSLYSFGQPQPESARNPLTTDSDSVKQESIQVFEKKLNLTKSNRYLQQESVQDTHRSQPIESEKNELCPNKIDYHKPTVHDSPEKEPSYCDEEDEQSLSLNQPQPISHRTQTEDQEHPFSDKEAIVAIETSRADINHHTAEQWETPSETSHSPQGNDECADTPVLGTVTQTHRFCVEGSTGMEAEERGSPIREIEAYGKGQYASEAQTFGNSDVKIRINPPSPTPGLVQGQPLVSVSTTPILSPSPSEASIRSPSDKAQPTPSLQPSQPLNFRKKAPAQHDPTPAQPARRPTKSLPFGQCNEIEIVLDEEQEEERVENCRNEEMEEKGACQLKEGSQKPFGGQDRLETEENTVPPAVNSSRCALARRDCGGLETDKKEGVECQRRSSAQNESIVCATISLENSRQCLLMASLGDRETIPIVRNSLNKFDSKRKRSVTPDRERHEHSPKNFVRNSLKKNLSEKECAVNQVERNVSPSNVLIFEKKRGATSVILSSKQTAIKENTMNSGNQASKAKIEHSDSKNKNQTQGLSSKKSRVALSEIENIDPKDNSMKTSMSPKSLSSQIRRSSSTRKKQKEIPATEEEFASKERRASNNSVLTTKVDMAHLSSQCNTIAQTAESESTHCIQSSKPKPATCEKSCETELLSAELDQKLRDFSKFSDLFKSLDKDNSFQAAMALYSMLKSS